MNSAPDFVSKFYADRFKIGNDGRKYDVLGGGALMPTEARVIYSLVERYQLHDCVEVGTGFGASAVAICAALKTIGGGHLWTVDPFQDKLFGNAGLQELQRFGFDGLYTFLPEFAEDVFYEKSKAGSTFDMIFQDGAHNVGSKMTHTFFGNKLLKPGGLFVFHDAFKPCASACATYLSKDLGYEVVPLRPDAQWKRMLRVVRHGFRRGAWFGLRVAPHTHLNLVALRKPQRPEVA